MHYIPHSALLDLDEIRDVDLRKSIFREMAKDLLTSSPADKAASIARLMEKAFKAGFELAREDGRATTSDRLVRRMTAMDLPSLSRNHLSTMRTLIFEQSYLDLRPGIDRGVGDPGQILYLWIPPNIAFRSGRWKAVEEDHNCWDSSEKVLRPLIKSGLLQEFTSNGQLFCFLTDYGYELLRTGETSLPDDRDGVDPQIAEDYHRAMQASADDFPRRSKAREERQQRDQEEKVRKDKQRQQRKDEKNRVPELRVQSVGGDKNAIRILEIIDKGNDLGKSAPDIVKDLEAAGVEIDYRSLPKLRSDLIEGLGRHGYSYASHRYAAALEAHESIATLARSRHTSRQSSLSHSSFAGSGYNAMGQAPDRPQPPPTPPRDPSQPPSYNGLQTYKADQATLFELGINSVREMVDKINEARRASGLFPVSQGDYPGSKAAFERLLREYRSLAKS